MFAIQTAIKYTEKSIWRYFFWAAIVFVVAVIAVTIVIACRNDNVGSSSITVVDAIELTCNVEINESAEISIYKLTVAGCLGTGKEFSEDIPPVVSQSFDLITDGTIESIENIVMFMYVNGSTEAVRYDFAYAVLERVDIDRLGK